MAKTIGRGGRPRRDVHCGPVRRLLRPVAWCALALVASVPVTALACQWECAFEEPTAGHHAGHRHDPDGAAPLGVAGIGAFGDDCAHPSEIGPVITGEAFKLAAATAMFTGDVIGSASAAGAVARPSPPADHGPPGSASRFLVLRI